jgi:hypothetical protein
MQDPLLYGDDNTLESVGYAVDKIPSRNHLPNQELARMETTVDGTLVAADVPNPTIVVRNVSTWRVVEAVISKSRGVPLGPVDPENNIAVKSRNIDLAILLHPIVYARRFVPMQFLPTGDVPAGDYLLVADSFADH